MCVGMKFAGAVLIKHIVFKHLLICFVSVHKQVHGLENTEILILKTKALGERDHFSCLPLIHSASSRDSDGSVEECQE